MYEGLEKIISEDRIKYNEPMSKHTTIRIGGNADVLVLPESIDEITRLLNFAKLNSIKVTVIGNGSKIVVSDEGIEGMVIKISSKMSEIKIENEYVYAEAGATMPAVSVKACNESLSGFEFACGIPGSIGGGVKMNAGAYGFEIKDTLVSCKYLDENLNIVKKNKDQLEFDYRRSFFTNNPQCVVLTALFKLNKSSKEEIAKKMSENSDARKSKQPLDFPNAGSTFKRPKGYFVGKLVDDAGLRGYKIGGAEVSKKHSGFIVNTGDATCRDVKELVEYMKKVIREKFDVELEPEIEFIGRNI